MYLLCQVQKLEVATHSKIQMEEQLRQEEQRVKELQAKIQEGENIENSEGQSKP
jgi:hypothetical protein